MRPNPRMAITVTPETRAVLERLSESSGIAASQFVASVLHNAIPMFESLARAFEIAKKNPQAAVDAMGEALEASMVQAAQMHLDLSKKPAQKKLRRRPQK